MRRQYEMSEAQLAALLEACKPTPVMYLSGGQPMFRPAQENANLAWAALGQDMKFDYLTVRPTDRGPRFFTAESTES